MLFSYKRHVRGGQRSQKRCLVQELGLATGSQGPALSAHPFPQHVKARSPRAALPPLYALELLTIYAWEMGTEASESFRLDQGLVTVMELLQEYESLCIYWTKYYTFQTPIIEDVVRKQLQRERYRAPPSKHGSEGEAREPRGVLLSVPFGEGLY